MPEEVDTLENDIAQFRGSPSIEEKQRLIETIREMQRQYEVRCDERDAWIKCAKAAEDRLKFAPARETTPAVATPLRLRDITNAVDRYGQDAFVAGYDCARKEAASAPPAVPAPSASLKAWRALDGDVRYSIIGDMEAEMRSWHSDDQINAHHGAVRRAYPVAIALLRELAADGEAKP